MLKPSCKYVLLQDSSRSRIDRELSLYIYIYIGPVVSKLMAFSSRTLEAS
jgi:hypothetical protein